MSEPQWKYLILKDETRVKVDAEDYDLLLKRSWRKVEHSGGKISVVTSIRKGKLVRTMTLGQFLMDPEKGKHVYPRRWNDGLDYRKSNLIVCSMKERQRMMPKLKQRGTSIFRGVSYIKSKRKWRARIEVDGKSIYLGDFDSEKEAALAYNRASREHFGKHGYQNQMRRLTERRGAA